MRIQFPIKPGTLLRCIGDFMPELGGLLTCQEFTKEKQQQPGELLPKNDIVMFLHKKNEDKDGFSIVFLWKGKRYQSFIWKGKISLCFEQVRLNS